MEIVLELDLTSIPPTTASVDTRDADARPLQSTFTWPGIAKLVVTHVRAPDGTFVRHDYSVTNP